MSRSEEWDWPPPRRPQSRVIDGESRITEERIVAPPRPAWAKRINPNQVVDRISAGLIIALKMLAAIPLAAIVLGALWLIATILKA